MELIKYENNLPAKSQEILRALESPLVLNSSDEVVKDQIKKAMLRSYFDLGFSYPSDNDFPVMVQSILNNVRMEGMALRLDEISIAFSRGILKEYGEFMGLSVASFSGFIKSYIMNNARLEALREKNKPAEAKREPTDQEKFQTAKENALRAYEDIKQDKDITLYGSVVYDFLDSLKLIEFTNEEKCAFYEKAKDKLIKENQIKAAGKVDQFLLAKIKKIIEGLQTGEEKDLIKPRAKVLSLTSYLQGLMLDEADLSELIDDVYLPNPE